MYHTRRDDHSAGRVCERGTSADLHLHAALQREHDLRMVMRVTEVFAAITPNPAPERVIRAQIIKHVKSIGEGARAHDLIMKIPCSPLEIYTSSY